jgi:hypothetical protein
LIGRFRVRAYFSRGLGLSFVFPKKPEAWRRRSGQHDRLKE